MRLPSSRGQAGSIREVPFPIPIEDEEPTAPYPMAVSRPSPRDSSLTVPSLTKAEAGQLASIIAAWEGANQSDRTLLAEIAKLLTTGPQQRKTLREMYRRAEAGAITGTRKAR